METVSKKVCKEIAQDGLTINAILFATIGVVAYTDTYRPSLLLMVMITFLALTPWMTFVMLCRASAWSEDQEESETDTRPPEVESSPWKKQQELMRISGQELASSPEMTKHALMYGALLMEEAGETFTAVAKGIESFLETTHWPSASKPNALWQLVEVRHRFSVAAATCEENAAVIRASLDRHTVKWAMPAEVAAELLDGLTDVMVVTCGFSLAAGLPGEAGFDEVCQSNLSKANPDTGVIDKTSDGKWIKGRNYRKPDLLKLIPKAPRILPWSDQ